MMKINEFETMLAVTGADINKWPQAKKSEAEKLLNDSEEARNILKEAAWLENTLDEFSVTPHSADLKERIMEETWLADTLAKFTVPPHSPNLKDRIMRALAEEFAKHKKSGLTNVVPFLNKKIVYWPAVGTAMAAALAFVLVFVPGNEEVAPKAPMQIAKIEQDVAPEIIEQPAAVLQQQIAQIEEPAVIEVPQQVAVVEKISEEEEAEIDSLLLALAVEEAFEKEISELL